MTMLPRSTDPASAPSRRYPFLGNGFVDAMDDAVRAAPQLGWHACHASHGDGWLPLYRRDQSRGEYVFDYSWADAYARHGMNYYPKLVTAVPFTPVTGPRWRGQWSADQLWQQVQQALDEQQAHSWHLLFPDQGCRDALADLPLIERHACHFRWFNRDYQSWDDFLGALQSRKRKNMRKERQRIAQQGLRVSRRIGADISADDWALFYPCYANTYLIRGQIPYLPESFFRALATDVTDQLMMVVAEDGQGPVAVALYLFDDQALYGRYWGALRDWDGLHFELCYYQGIEFAIEQGLGVFDPGVQGEHKLLRGFEPVITRSLHYLKHPEFHQAVARFCQEEASHVQAYQEQARSVLPYRNPP